MAKRSMTVRRLAEEAGIDLDVAIVSLWDVGLEYVGDAGDLIRSSDMSKAKRAVGVATPRQVRSADYWKAALGLDEEAFVAVLVELGIPKRDGSNQLPKGAVAKLTKYARGRHLRPVPAATEQIVPTLAPLVWKTVGRERQVRQLNADEIRRIHEQLVVDFSASDDPIDPPGVRDENLLESATFRQHTSFGEKDKYPTVEMNAAALVHSLVHDHPFHNGNKRTALVAMLVLLDENSLILSCEEDVLFKFILQVAQHRLAPRDADNRDDREVIEIAEWILKHSRRVETGERLIAWRRLKRVLGAFGCWWEPAHVGNRINIYRTIEEPGRFRRVRETRLHSQVHYRDDGTEVERNTMAKIRQELQLDDEHGVDSLRFYAGDDEEIAADFIIQYRKLLSRLARL